MATIISLRVIMARLSIIKLKFMYIDTGIYGRFRIVAKTAHYQQHVRPPVCLFALVQLSARLPLDGLSSDLILGTFRNIQLCLKSDALREVLKYICLR